MSEPLSAAPAPEDAAFAATDAAVSAGDRTGPALDLPPHLIDLGGGRRAEMRPHTCFACGDLNTHGLRLRFHVDGASAWTETIIGSRFVGWEDLVHGGILCTILDEVMAWSLIGQDCWGVTARMAVRFHRPTEAGQRVRAEGRLVERRRRVYRTEGQIVDLATGEVLASAEATYLDVPADRRDELKARYGFRMLDGGVSP